MLETQVRQYTSPYCDVIRAKIVLLAARARRGKGGIREGVNYVFGTPCKGSLRTVQRGLWSGAMETTVRPRYKSRL
jgi:hypothetical protein